MMTQIIIVYDNSLYDDAVYASQDAAAEALYSGDVAFEFIRFEQNGVDVTKAVTLLAIEKAGEWLAEHHDDGEQIHYASTLDDSFLDLFPRLEKQCGLFHIEDLIIDMANGELIETASWSHHKRQESHSGVWL